MECVGVERCTCVSGQRNEWAWANASIVARVEYGRLLVHCSSSYPWIGTRGRFGTVFSRVNVRRKWGRDETEARTGVSGRDPFRWLPAERLSDWGDSDCEYWANGAENTRVKYYRILVRVSLLLGEFLSDFLWFLWESFGTDEGTIRGTEERHVVRLFCGWHLN